MVEGDSSPAEFGPTITTPRDRIAAKPSYESSSASSSDSIDDARFTPGTMLLDRYRIVGLLGKGGMGEVYRADDLKLRQPVALKFLPESLSKNQSRLDRFHHEVRVARQVSHPNVCRVYDIGEADGHPFITMEYVSGEDLASVLRRMGKPSGDKAIQIARQICAGLAAAHDKGVLHRDLKPHNIMIDDQGRVRITDFGLAGFVEEFTEKELQAGTPAYMSPEQIAGKDVSVKSDLYSLGLVLFELFTGRRAFKGNNKQELLSHRDETDITTLSTRLEGVDSTVERVILRCLESQPAARPSSAMAVAAALPGGDPLAAALAAGETPDPELVANAGEKGGLRPAVALPLLLFVLVGIVGIGWITSDSIYRLAIGSQPPEALKYRAQDIIHKLGYDKPPVDSRHGFTFNGSYLIYENNTNNSQDRWEKIKSQRPSGILYWYRQHPHRELIPANSDPHVLFLDRPPFNDSGELYVKLDTKGRLFEFAMIPPRIEDPDVKKTKPFDDWEILFEEAGLDFHQFQPTEPAFNGHLYCDQRMAWEGYFENQPDMPIRVEAGSYGDKPNCFKITGPWLTTSSTPSESNINYQRISGFIFVGIILLGMYGGMYFAWKNLKLKRGDRRGAFRASLFYVICGYVVWLLDYDHVNQPWVELFRHITYLGVVYYFTISLWTLYIAFEPYVRRRWPHALISWNRVVMGRIRDPLVGRDILVGCVLGVGMVFCWNLSYIAPTWSGELAPISVDQFANPFVVMSTLTSSASLIARMVHPWFIFIAIWHLFIIFALRILLRNQWIAVIAYVLIFTIIYTMSGPVWSTATGWLINMCCYAGWLILMALSVLRFGLLTMITANLFHDRFQHLVVTLDTTSWHFSSSLFILIVMSLIAVYGFHTSLAGRSLLKDELLEN